jgi:dTDP-4-amino-4,6-dideoxygalactose transaminase
LEKHIIMPTSQKIFEKVFTQQEPLPETAITQAVKVMRSGRLHRYNIIPGEIGEAAMLEQEFASYMGMKYCLACASCGSAMYLALKSAGVKPGDTVLCNAFTLAPVPGMIENSGAQICLVEITNDYTINLTDLEQKAKASSAKWLLLSHMRGHIADMEQLVSICKKNGLVIIEDCAHTMGAKWNGRKSGSFGLVGCFSTQTYKHINSGEGGLLVTNDAQVIARAILFSGSYMLYDKHTSRPDLEVFEPYKLLTPNYSCRMDNLRASILRPQLALLDQRCEGWNQRYRIIEALLNQVSCISCPLRDPREKYVGSSIQFNLIGFDEAKIRMFLQDTKKRGVQLKWFGGAVPTGFTSAYHSWRYFGNLPMMPETDRVLSTLFDMRIPLTFTLEDCQLIAEIIAETANSLME